MCAACMYVLCMPHLGVLELGFVAKLAERKERTIEKPDAVPGARHVIVAAAGRERAMQRAAQRAAQTCRRLRRCPRHPTWSARRSAQTSRGASSTGPDQTPRAAEPPCRRLATWPGPPIAARRAPTDLSRLLSFGDTRQPRRALPGLACSWSLVPAIFCYFFCLFFVPKSSSHPARQRVTVSSLQRTVSGTNPTPHQVRDVSLFG